MKKRIFAIITAVSLLLTSCHNQSADVESDTYGTDNRGGISSGISDVQAGVGFYSGLNNNEDERYFTITIDSGESKEYALSKEEWGKFFDILDNIRSEEMLLIRDPENSDSVFDYSLNAYFTKDNEPISYTVNRVTGEYERYVEVKNGSTYSSPCYYPVNEELDKFVYAVTQKHEGQGGTGSDEEQYEKSVPDRLLDCTCQCEEPFTKDEYIQAARMTVSVWLDSLKNETGRYHLETYEFDGAHYEREFQAAGMVDGVKEFAVFVAFSAEGLCDEETEDSAFDAVGTYDTFYHYYFGPSVYARFRWQDGTCSLIDYTDSYSLLTGEGMKYGLTGINTESPKYPTFFEFLADKENVEQLLEQQRDRDWTQQVLSHNVMMLSDGTICFADIYCKYDEYSLGQDGRVSSRSFQEFYTTERDTYSSPVEYSDELQSAIVIPFNPQFSLIFDDYNSDGAPDFAVKIGEDENGSTYEVSCMSSAGTPWEDKTTIYLAGHFEDSLRLQLLGRGIAAVTEMDETGIKISPDTLFYKGDDYPEVIDNYRMYSQRYYMPLEKRSYKEGTPEITMNFWNNTDTDVTAGGNYIIERKNGSNWEKIGNGSCPEFVAAKNGGYGEFTIDTSAINEAAICEYRVVMLVNGQEVYGGFYMGSRPVPELEIIGEEDLPAEKLRLNFFIKNTGSSGANNITATLYKDGQPVCEVECPEKILTNETAQITVEPYENSGCFSAGEYTLSLTCGERSFTGTTRLLDIPPESRYCFGQPEIIKTQNGFSIKIENIMFDKSDVIFNWGDITVYRDGEWRMPQYGSVWSDDYEVELKYGEAAELEHTSIVNDIDKQEFLVVMFWGFTEGEISIPDFFKFLLLDIDQAIEEVFGIYSIRPGDLCRVELVLPEKGKKEILYFTF